ncbi:DUF4215 domain-containing protein, partial [Myxococcota bacterium]|nr:DUF4215 domain-containing protein [Myxococcota bacterium]
SALCGDGLIDGTESCDDGAPASDDGCSSSCTVEPGWLCLVADTPCTPDCGDGLRLPVEDCDDGDTTGGDGCSATCTVEPGYTCPIGQVCAPICGDALAVAGEGCDDGNTSSGDGCSASCAPETGFDCPPPSTVCTAICGDALVRGAETCDDGDALGGDGCSESCTLEPGYTCPVGQVCSPICGDGLVRGNEVCDDGDVDDGDGCAALCTIEAGFGCRAEPSICERLCGNGVLEGAEACDDGGVIAGDGCDASCGVEAGFSCMRRPSVCAPTLQIAFVDDTGPGCPASGGTGAPASPYCSIGLGLASASPWLFVLPGTYSEALVVDARAVAIVADAAVLDEATRATPAIRVQNGSAATIVGLAVSGGSMRVDVVDSAATLVAMTIGPETTGLGISITGGSTVTIDRTIVTNNAGGGLLLDGAGPHVVTNVVLSGNGLPGITPFGGLRVARAPAGSRLANLTIADNRASLAGDGVAGVRCDVAVSLVNVIVWGNTSSGVPTSLGPSCAATYSDLDPFVAGLGNFSVDPLLSVTYRLLPGSPAIDAGDPAGVFPAGPAPAIDVDAERRPEGVRVDVGADERL